jgi:hypothetical protein
MLGREPATTSVREMLDAAERAEVRLLMSAINVGEVYYFLKKSYGEVYAEAWRDSMGPESTDPARSTPCQVQSVLVYRTQCQFSRGGIDWKRGYLAIPV